MSEIKLHYGKAATKVIDTLFTPGDEPVNNNVLSLLHHHSAWSKKPFKQDSRLPGAGLSTDRGMATERGKVEDLHEIVEYIEQSGGLEAVFEKKQITEPEKQSHIAYEIARAGLSLLPRLYMDGHNDAQEQEDYRFGVGDELFSHALEWQMRKDGRETTSQVSVTNPVARAVVDAAPKRPGLYLAQVATIVGSASFKFNKAERERMERQSKLSSYTNLEQSMQQGFMASVCASALLSTDKATADEILTAIFIPNGAPLSLRSEFRDFFLMNLGVVRSSLGYEIEVFDMNIKEHADELISYAIASGLTDLNEMTKYQELEYLLGFFQETIHSADYMQWKSSIAQKLKESLPGADGEQRAKQLKQKYDLGLNADWRDLPENADIDIRAYIDRKNADRIPRLSEIVYSESE